MKWLKVLQDQRLWEERVTRYPVMRIVTNHSVHVRQYHLRRTQASIHRTSLHWDLRRSDAVEALDQMQGQHCINKRLLKFHQSLSVICLGKVLKFNMISYWVDWWLILALVLELLLVNKLPFGSEHSEIVMNVSFDKGIKLVRTSYMCWPYY